MADMTRRIVLELLAKNKAAGEMAAFNRGISSLYRSMMQLAGIGGGVYMLQRGLRSMASATIEQEKAEVQLRAAIGNNIAGMKEYAASMQKQTIYGDELILSQMAYGANLGITTDRLQDATKAAIGLAAKYRLELNSAMMLVGRASQGQTQMLTRYGIVLDDTLSPQEKFNKLLEIGSENFYLAKKDTESAAGAYEQYKNMVSDLSETLGGPLLNSLTKVGKAITDNSDEWAEFFKQQAEGWAEILSGLESVRTVAKEIAKSEYKGKSNMELLGLAYGGGQAGKSNTIPEGKLEISPYGYQQISRMNNYLYEQKQIQNFKDEFMKYSGALPGTEGASAFMFLPGRNKDQVKAEEKAAYDIARAYVRMYDSIDSKSSESFKWREKLINAEYKLYAQKADDIVLIEKLKQERIKQLQMQEALARGGSLEGIGVALYEIRQEIPSIGKIFHDITIELNTGLVDGLNEALWKTKDLNMAMKELGLSIAKMATQMLLQIAVGNTMAGIGGALHLPFLNASVGHSGGRVGSLSDRRLVSPSVFADAPKFHDLRPGETAVIAQDDEVISRPGGMSGSAVEIKLDKLIDLLSQRQTINANIIDKRDVVTAGRMEGRDGEKWTLKHLQRNG